MIKRYLKLKFLFGQGNQHISIISSVAKDVMIGGMFLDMLGFGKYFNAEHSYVILGMVIGVCYISCVVFIGYLAVRFKVVEEENTIAQAHNKEIQKLLSRQD